MLRTRKVSTMAAPAMANGIKIALRKNIIKPSAHALQQTTKKIPPRPMAQKNKRRRTRKAQQRRGGDEQCCLITMDIYVLQFPNAAVLQSRNNA